MTVPLVPATKPGYRTTELYATLTPVVLTALTMVFHRDFSGYVQAAGIAVSGIAAAAYAVSRAHLKRPVDLASALFDLRALLLVAGDVGAAAKAAQAAAPVAP